MNRFSLIIIGILLLLLGGCIFYICNQEEKVKIQTKIVHRIDTVYKEKIKVVTVQAPEKPAKVIIQTKRDTVFRKEVEKKDIIIGESINNNQLHVQTIDSVGVEKETITNIPEDTKEVKVDQEGHVEIKKRKKFRAWVDRSAKHIKNGLAVVGGVAIIVVVAALASGG